MAKTTEKPLSKSEIVAKLAEMSELEKKQVQSVLDNLEGLIGTALGRKGSGTFVVPGLMKIVRIEKKATPAKQGRNPKTGETITISAKPARKVVKVRALKKLKEML
jgi:DNA-binding protein HU-beta